MLPSEVIATDHQLEQIADKASGQLAQHRWHWTLDASNPERVPIREYARAVGRSDSTIGASAHGYAQYMVSARGTPGGSPTVSVAEAVSRAGMGEESRAAADAVSRARGVAFDTAKTNYRDETRRVREIARQRAEERGTSIEDEAPKVAEVIVRHERAEQANEAEKAEHTDVRFVEMEGYLVKAKRELLKALKIAPVVPWDDESRELLTETVANVKALLGLIDTALSGSSGVDWDAAFAKVAGDEKL